jgi:hypothetical protein
VAGRWLYYNRSGYDGTGTTGADSSDDNALADDKVALLPGHGPATFANLTNTARGITGLFVDLADMPPTSVLAASDFEFRTGTGGDPSTWTAALAPNLVAIRRGAGVGGSDRVSLSWPDSFLRNTWLQVTVKANARTGLAQPDVFYFGNLVGDSGEGNSPTVARVNALDLAAVRRRFITTATAQITNPFDADRDGKVNALDLAAVKQGLGHTLEMINPPAVDPVPPPVAAAPFTLFSAAPVVGMGRRSGDADVLGAGAGDLLA